MTFEDLMRSYVNEDYDVLVATAKKTFNEFYPVCKQLDKDNDGFVLVTAIILSAIGADGKLSAHFEHTVLVTKDGCQLLTGE